MLRDYMEEMQDPKLRAVSETGRDAKFSRKACSAQSSTMPYTCCSVRGYIHMYVVYVA